MFTINSPASSAAVRLTVRPACQASGWGLVLRRAGWRSFMRTNGRDKRTITCLLKRGASCIALTQDPELPIDQTVMLPSDETRELCSLFVTSGLAVPALQA